MLQTTDSTLQTNMIQLRHDTNCRDSSVRETSTQLIPDNRPLFNSVMIVWLQLEPYSHRQALIQHQ